MTVDIKTSRVRDVMSRVVITVGPEDTMQDALGSMAQYRVTALPVTDARNRCVGIAATAIAAPASSGWLPPGQGPTRLRLA